MMLTTMLMVLAMGQSDGDAAALKPTAPWSVEYAETGCALSRTYGDAAAPVTMVFQPDIFGGTMKAFATGTRKQLGRLGQGPVILSVPGREAPIKVSGTLVHLPTGERAVLQYYLPSEAFASLNGAASVTIDLPNGKPTTVALSLTKPAVAALQRCGDDLLQKLGYDPAKVAMVATPPQSNPAAWITDEDYPEAARKAKQQGKVTVVLTISEAGRVNACRVLVSSGASVLDEATCRIITRNGRFGPGLDAQGKPVESYKSIDFTWTLPR